MLGRGIYAIGGDEAAAERAGFNVRAIKMFLYCLVGVIAGVTGIVRISMIAYADPSTMLGMELTVIAAVVLGGTRVTGGVGTLIGTIFGVALMTILDNSLILIGIPTYWSRAFTGAVIIIGTGVTARQSGSTRRRDRALSRPRRKHGMTAADAPVGRRPRRSRDPNLVRLLVMLVLVFVLMTILRPGQFATLADFNSMMRQFPEYGIMAIGMSLTMMTGGIDLGVVGTANLSAIVAAMFLIAAVPAGAPPAEVVPYLVAAVLLALATGLACGAIAGTLISRFNIPAILATLGTQQLFTGIAIGLTGGRPQSRLPLLYSKIGNTEFLHFFPLSFILFVAIALAVGFMLSRTRFGAYIYMIGTNAKAAKYAGLNNASIILGVYMVSGFLSSIAGLIMMARANSAKADYGAPYMLQCVLIAVLGGVDPNGGFGKIAGVTMAIFILQFLSSGLNMFNSVSNFYRDVIWGGVLILVLVFNHFFSRRADRRAVRKAS